MQFGIPAFVRVEMVPGTQNKLDQNRVIKLMQPLSLIYPNEADAK